MREKRTGHTLLRRAAAALLTLCMLLTMVPAVATEVEPRTLTGFVALSDEVREQTVPHGAARRDLILPDTLEAVALVPVPAEPEKSTPPEEPSPSPAQKPEESTPPVEPEKSTPPEEPPAQEPEEPASSPAQEPPAEPDAEQTPAPAPEQVIEDAEPPLAEAPNTEAVSISGVSWESAPEYDGAIPGTYVFTPVLPAFYVLEAGVSLPEITVTVEEPAKLEKSTSPVAAPGGALTELTQPALDAVFGAGGVTLNGSVVTLNADITLAASITAGPLDFTLDLNGKRITYTATNQDKGDAALSIEGGAAGPPATLTITDSSTEQTGAIDGGVQCALYATYTNLTIAGGTLTSANSVYYEGTVVVVGQSAQEPYACVNITGGKIETTATNREDVALVMMGKSENATLTISGGTVSAPNPATRAIYCSTKVNISGDAVIAASVQGGQSIADNSYSRISITGSPTITGTIRTLTSPVDVLGYTGGPLPLEYADSRAAAGDIVVKNCNDPAQFPFYTPNFTLVPSGNDLVLEAKPLHVHDDGMEFQEWKNPWGMPDDSGNYYLSTDVKNVSAVSNVNGMYFYKGDTNICLCGHSVDLGEDEIYIKSSPHYDPVNLSIYDDAAGTGIIFNDSNHYFGGDGYNLYMPILRIIGNKATVNLYGGTLENRSGTGAHVREDSVVNIYGGAIKAGDNVGLLMTAGGRVNMTDGVVQSAGSVGASISDRGELRLSGGTLEGGKGGISVQNKLYLSGKPVIEGGSEAPITVSGGGSNGGSIVANDGESTPVYYSGDPLDVALNVDTFPYTLVTGLDKEATADLFLINDMFYRVYEQPQGQEGVLKAGVYGIAQQPLAENKYTVGVNAPPDESVGYQWYRAQKSLAILGADDVTSEAEGTVLSSYHAALNGGKGGWETPSYMGYGMSMYFMVSLAGGGTFSAKFTSPGGADIVQMAGLMSAAEGVDFVPLEAGADGVWRGSIPVDAPYMLVLMIQDAEGNSVEATDVVVTDVTAVKFVKGEAIESQQAAQLTDFDKGAAMCKVTFANGYSVFSSPAAFAATVTIGGAATAYATFADAWAAATASSGSEGATVKLMDDVTPANHFTANNTPITVPTGQTVTLDLNGFAIDRGLTAETAAGNVILVEGALTLDDTSAGKTGKVTGGNHTGSGGGIVANGDLTLRNSAITGNVAPVGGGLYAGAQGASTPTVKLSGNVTIDGNTDADGNASNAALESVSDDVSCVLTIAGALTGKIGVGVMKSGEGTTPVPLAGTVAVADAAYNSGALTAADAACFESDNPAFAAVAAADQKTIVLIDAVAAAKAAAEGASYAATTQAATADENAAKDYVQRIAATAVNDSTITVTVTEVGYTAPVTGTSADPGGTDGSYVFTVTVSKDAQSETTTQKTLTITATAFTGTTDAQAVAAAKTAVVDGSVNVAFGADQAAKTAAVQTYVNGLLTAVPLAAGVTATVTHQSGNSYSVAFHKGSANDSKAVTMTIHEAPDPDIDIVNAAKQAAEQATYTATTQAATATEDAAKAYVEAIAPAAVNNGSVTVAVNRISYTAPVAGTFADPDGTDGSYVFTVTLSKGHQSQTTAPITLIITAAPCVTITVSFDTQGANGGDMSPPSREIYPGAPYGTLPAPTKDGVSFTGWYTAASGGTLVTQDTPVALDANHHTLYARWGEWPTLAEVYVDGERGGNHQSGASAETAVKTFAEAKKRLASGGTIYICGTLTPVSSETWSLTDKGEAKLQRAAGFTGVMVRVQKMLTMQNLTLDGGGILAQAPMIVVEKKGRLDLERTGEGKTVLTGNHNDSSSDWGGALRVEQGGKLNLYGVTAVQGNRAAKGGGIYVANGADVTLSGRVTMQGNANAAGAADNLYLADGAFVAQSNLDSDDSVLVGLSCETPPATLSQPVKAVVPVSAGFGQLSRYVSDNDALQAVLAGTEIALRQKQDVVYVGGGERGAANTGDDPARAVASMDQALSYVSDGGTIVVCGATDRATITTEFYKAVTVTGSFGDVDYSGAVLDMKTATLRRDVTFRAVKMTDVATTKVLKCNEPNITLTLDGVSFEKSYQLLGSSSQGVSDKLIIQNCSNLPCTIIRDFADVTIDRASVLDRTNGIAGYSLGNLTLKNGAILFTNQKIHNITSDKSTTTLMSYGKDLNADAIVVTGSVTIQDGWPIKLATYPNFPVRNGVKLLTGADASLTLEKLISADAGFQLVKRGNDIIAIETPAVTLAADKPAADYTGSAAITLTATAVHSDLNAAFTYEWYRGGVKLDVEDSSTLALQDVADSGSYTVKVRAVSGGLTSAWAESNPVTATISKATPTVSTLPAASAISYGQALSESALTGGAADTPGAFAWVDGSAKPAVADSDATEYRVSFTPNDAANYNAATCAVKLTVRKAILTVSATADDKTYDGTTAATGAITLSGAVNDENPAATGAFTFASAGAGDDKTVHVTAITLSGDWGENYAPSVTETTATASITPRSLGGGGAVPADGITVDAIADQPYKGGAAVEPLPVVKADGAALSKDTDYTLSYAANTIPGAATVTITGKGNYSDSVTATFTIVLGSAPAGSFTLPDDFESDVWTKNDIVVTGAGYTVSTSPDRDFAADLTLDAEGSRTVTIYVKDANTSAVTQAEVAYKLDKTAPVVGTVTGNPVGWVTSAEIAFAPTDTDGSGVETVTVTPGGTLTPDEEGNYGFAVTQNGAYTITVTDEVGNAATETVEVTKVDTTAPTASISPIPEDGKWYGGTTVTATAADGDSGVAEYSFDGGDTWHSEHAKIFTDGEHTITLWVKDGAGNLVKLEAVTLRVDSAIDDFAAQVGALSGASELQDLLDALADYTANDHIAASDKGAAAYEALVEYRTQKYDDMVSTINGTIAAQGPTRADVDTAATLYDLLDTTHQEQVDKAMLDALVADKEAAERFVAAMTPPKPETWDQLKNLVEQFNTLSDTPKALLTQEELAAYHALTLKHDAIRDFIDAVAAITKPYDTDTAEKITTAGDKLTAAEAVGAEGFIPDEVMAQYKDAEGALAKAQAVEEKITQLPDHNPGAVDCTDMDTHKPNLEEAKLDYEKLNQEERNLMDGETVQKLSEQYDALMKHLNYISRKDDVEVVGLAENVDTSSIGAPGDTVTIELSVEKTSPIEESAKTALEAAKSAALAQNAKAEQAGSYDVKLLAKVNGGAAQEVQPDKDAGKSVVVRIKLADTLKLDTLTIYHIHDGNPHPDLVDYTLVKEQRGSFAVMEADQFSYFVLFAEKEATPPPVDPGTSGGGSGGSSTAWAPEIIRPEHGTLTVSPERAKLGDQVSVTVKPDAGYAVDEITVTDKNGKEVAVTDNGDGTYTYTQPNGKATIAVTFQAEKPPIQLPFTDVAETDWFRDSVVYIYGQGLMNGTGDTTFSPYLNTDRGMIVTILWRMEGSPATTAATAFPDVASGLYYSEAVAWGADQNIITGYSNGLYCPSDPITREQLAAILWRYAKYKGWDVSAGESTNILSYLDYPQISEYAVPALQWAVGEGIMNGKGGGILDPRGPATRAEVAAMLERLPRP